jgi:hypothetical protein
MTCFTSAACSKILQRSTSECSIPLNLQIYRQIVVAVSKKHLPSLVQPFDSNTPREYDELSRLFSFQTGHNPATHAGAYALDRAYPAKLQPDLVERYFYISQVWHRFLTISEEHSTTAGTKIDRPSPEGLPRAPSPLLHKTDALLIKRGLPADVSSQDDTVLPGDISVHREIEELWERKHGREGSTSPTQKKIDALRADLVHMEHEYRMQKLCKAASQRMMPQGSEGHQNPLPQYRKRGSKVSLSNCAEILCFLEEHRVLICKQHQTAVVNLDTHLFHYHHVPASIRRQVVDCFSRLKPLDPAEVRLPDKPAKAIAELRKPLTGLRCKACRYITINTNALRKHCKKDYQKA